MQTGPPLTHSRHQHAAANEGFKLVGPAWFLWGVWWRLGGQRAYTSLPCFPPLILPPPHASSPHSKCVPLEDSLSSLG